MIKGVLLDFDGTIVDSEISRLKSTNQVLKQYKVKISQKEWDQKYVHLGSVVIFYEIKKKYRLDYNVEEMYDKAHKLRSEIEEREGVPLIKGFKKFHEELKKREIKVMICSGGTTEHMKEILEKHDLLGIDGFGRNEYENRKPAPDAFLLGLRKLDLLKSQVIVFEDSRTGVQAAQDLDIKTYLINTKLPEEEFKEVKRFKNFTKIRIDDLINAKL